MPEYSTDSSNTQRLLMRISSGDREAFNELFERFRSKLKTAVKLQFDRQLRVRLNTSDIVQVPSLRLIALWTTISGNGAARQFRSGFMASAAGT